ncbi:MAG TPA: LytTR family DNA-binding domain-containing protein [Saprospiraceae bacterium]|nr:LytTR family DNA-binding domain-containing protein [Saprospiraceae bacterium]HMQ82702.1 LytTR family DNA-binding domain-containing protein [Saprospiraceae bacterium]
MQVLIVEDEPLAVKKLERLLSEVAKDLEIVGTAGSIRNAVEWLESNPAPDLLFLDIELSDGQSFEIFQRTQVSSPVIFVTSYDEYALQAFKVNSVDYLLKPVQKEDLAQAINKYRDLKNQYSREAHPLTNSIENLLLSLNDLRQPLPYRTRFLVKHLQKYVSIEVAEIAYFWSEGRINFFKSRNGQKYIVEYTMEELENMLHPNDWFRVNRQFIVSVHCVSEIHPYFNNRLKLHLIPKEPEEVTVSRERVSAFKVWLGK